MNGKKFVLAQFDERLRYAAEVLQGAGAEVIFPNIPADAPSCDGLILPVPSERFIVSSPLELDLLLSHLKKGGAILSYGVRDPKYLSLFSPYRVIDYSADEDFQSINTISSAEGALSVLIENTKMTVRCAKILLTGWGKLAKCLYFMLRSLKADLVVCARSQTSRAEILSLGTEAVDICNIGSYIDRCDVVINTVPHPIISSMQLPDDLSGKVFLELASAPFGYDSEEVKTRGALSVYAPSLPSRFAPRSSGYALGRAVCRLFSEHRSI